MTIKDIRDIIDNVEIKNREDYEGLYNVCYKISNKTNNNTFLDIFIGGILHETNAYELKTILLDKVNELTSAKGVMNND